VVWEDHYLSVGGMVDGKGIRITAPPPLLACLTGGLLAQRVEEEQRSLRRNETLCFVPLVSLSPISPKLSPGFPGHRADGVYMRVSVSM